MLWPDTKTPVVFQQTLMPAKPPLLLCDSRQGDADNFKQNDRFILRSKTTTEKG